MKWVGLTPLSVALALAGFGAVITALYLLKQQPRRVVVPAIALWESLLGRRDTATLWTKLRRLWSLLLALLVLALTVFALADLRRRHDDSRRSLVLLIDASASMAAQDEAPSRLEAARRMAGTFVRNLGAEERAMIVQLDAQATAQSPLSDDGVALRKALSDVRQTDLAGDLSAGIRLALDVLEGQKQPEVVLFSDGNLEGIDVAAQLLAQTPVKMRYVRVGRSPRNLSITSFAVRRYPLDKTHHESIVTITSFAPTDERVRLTVHAGGALLFDDRLLVPKGGSVTRALSDLTYADDVLEARIAPEGGPDVLPTDDRAYATLPARTRSRVLVVSSGNRYLEAALLLDEYLEVSEVSPSAYRGAQGHDVVIFDRTLPQATPQTPSIYLAPPGEGGAAPFRVSGEVARPFFDRIEREHPLLRLTELSDVNVARASKVALEAGDRAIASTRDKLPLIVEGVRGGAPMVALTFDVRESDLPLRVSWPLFLLGAIDHLSREATGTVLKSEAGSVMHVALPEGASEAELIDKDGARERVKARAGRLRIVRERAGIYSLVAQGVSAKLAVNVPAALEGAVSPRARVLTAAEERPAQASRASLVGERTWPLLLALALFVLLVEWLTFHRRLTV